MKKKIIISTLFICISIALIWILYYSLWTGKKNIYIAVACSFSGKYKNYGSEVLKGVQLYVDQVNATGGIKGSAIKLLIFDDKGTVQGAVKVAKSIVRNKQIRLVLGHYFSSCSLKAAPVYEKNMMPSINYSATYDDLAKNNDWLFRIIPPNSYQSEFLTAFAKTTFNVKKACIIYDNDAYGSSLLKSFIEKAKELCIDIPLRISIDSENSVIDQHAKEIVQKINNTKEIDIIFLATHADISANLIVQLRKNKCNQIIIGADAMASSLFIDSLAAYQKKYAFSDIYTNGIYSVSWFHHNMSGKAYVDFAQTYKDKYHLKPSLISTTAYDAAHVAISALQSIDMDRSSRTVRKKIKQSLEQYYDQRHCIKGLTGNIYFDTFGDMKKSMIVMQLRKRGYIPEFTQYVSVSYEDIAENIIQKGIDESIIASDDEFFVKTNIAFIRLANVHFNQINFTTKTFHARFDIIFSVKGPFYPNNIHFINAKFPVVLEKPNKIIQHMDNSQTFIFTVDGIFTHDYCSKKYPFDTQTLSIALIDKHRSIDKIWFSAVNQIPVSFQLDTDKWSPLYSNSYIENKEMITDYGQIDIFSQYHADFVMKTKLTSKIILLFLPLCLFVLLVYIGYFIPVTRMNISIMVNVLLLIINTYFHAYFDNALPYINFSEYLYLFMYWCIGFTICFQAFLLTFHLKQLTRTVAVIRIIGIILYPIMITCTVFISYYLVSHI